MGFLTCAPRAQVNITLILKADEVQKEVNLWAENETNGLIKILFQLNLVD